jgi:DNA-binding beta-propeller fold protein YncE
MKAHHRASVCPSFRLAFAAFLAAPFLAYPPASAQVDYEYLFSEEFPFIGEKFSYPGDVAVNATHVYVADREDACVYMYSTSGHLERKIGERGTEDGQFLEPVGLELTFSRLYVTDVDRDNVQVFTPRGEFLFSIGGPGTGNGEFNNPFGVAAYDNRIYVTDSQNDRVQRFAYDGAYAMRWGSSGSGEKEFDLPLGITTDYNGDVYVADHYNDRIQKFSPIGTFEEEWTDLIDANAGSPTGSPRILHHTGGHIYMTTVTPYDVVM